MSEEFPANTIRIPSYYSGDFFEIIREVWKEQDGNLLCLTTRKWQDILLQRGTTHVKNQGGVPALIETEQEEARPEVDWPASWELARLKGLSPSQKSTLFSWTQNLLINGERLHRTGLKENPSCEACGYGNDNRMHFFNCQSFPRSSLGVQKMLLQLTGGESSKEDLAVLHVKLVNNDHRLPFAFLMAELIKGILIQKKTRKKEDWSRLEASIYAKKSFLTNIPHLAWVSDSISNWISDFFCSPGSTLTNPPPSASQASCARGDSAGKEIGIIGQPQQHLITNFFMKQPRPSTLTNETTSLHADTGPAHQGPILSTLQFQPSQAATAAPLVASQPDKEQRPTHFPVNRPGGEASSTSPATSCPATSPIPPSTSPLPPSTSSLPPSTSSHPTSTTSTATPDVQTETHRHGRGQCHRRFESRLSDRSSGCGSIRCSGGDLASHSLLHVRIQTGMVLDSYPRQEVGSPQPPEPDPGIHDSTAAGTDVNGHLHDAGLDHNQQPHDRDPRRRAVDSSKEKCNN